MVWALNELVANDPTATFAIPKHSVSNAAVRPYTAPSIITIILTLNRIIWREEKSMFDWMHLILRKKKLMFDSLHQFERFSLSPDDVPVAEKTQSELHKLFYNNTGTLVNKWRHYLNIYESHLSRFRHTPFHLLEIGVAQGGSLSLWRRYFGPKAVIFGIDIDDRCRRFDKRDAHVRIGSQDDPAFLRSVVSEMGGVDVVLDDGSHKASHHSTSFQTLFPLLNDGGVYICEDLHTAYSPTFDGGYRRNGSFIEVAKKIIDDIHADFHDQPQYVADAHRSIHGIYFYNSMLVIEKRAQQEPRYIQVGP